MHNKNPPNSALAADKNAGSSARFGYSWSKFNEPTLQQREQFWGWTSALQPHAWKDARFLDVGCGTGRNAKWAMEAGARSGVAIDIDDNSLEIARRNLSSYPSVEVRGCSAYEAPEEDFDIAFSLGVIHHLAEPQRAIEAMTRSVQTGGKVLIWVYGRENMEFYVRVLSPLRDAIFSRLPVSLLRLIAFIPAAFLWLLLRSGYMRLEYFKQLRQFSFRHLHHIIFDQMLPQISHHWPREKAEELLHAAGLNDVRSVWVNDISWSVVGTKRSA